MALHNKDITVDNNGCSQESIVYINEESKIDNKVTEDPLTNPDDGDYVADTEDGVKNHQPVQKCFSWLLHDEFEKIAIGCEYQ